MTHATQAVGREWAAGLRPRYLPTARGYETKLSAIKHGHAQELLPGEFLRYLLVDRDGRRAEEPAIIAAFEKQIGRASGYLRSDVFYNARHLSLPLCDKLTALSETSTCAPKPDIYFWGKGVFSSSEADGIVLDPQMDLSIINARYHHIGGGPTKASNRAAIVDAAYRGL